MATTDRNTKKTFLIAAGALIAAIWAGVFAAIVILQPALKTRMMIAAVGAGSTELIIYIGAAWFGVNLYKHIRSKLAARRG
jgi:hypothetical protein